MLTLVGGYDAQVAEWAGAQLGKPIIQPFAALAIVLANEIRGAVIFNDFQGPNGSIEMTYVGRGTMTRGILRSLARYAFVENNASRVTFKTRSGNAQVKKLLYRHGLEYEGRLRGYYSTAKGGDALCFVLHRNKASRWLGG